MCLTLFLATRRICRFFSLGDRLYSVRALRFASMIGVISADLALNQSCDFRVFFPKVAKAVRCMVSRKVVHFAVAESPGCEIPSSFSNLSANFSTRSGWLILLTSMQGFPCFLPRWNLLGCSLTLRCGNSVRRGRS